MEFFLDTANLEEIEKAKEMGLIDGVTTNPSLLAKEGGDWRSQAREICQMVNGPVSLEVVATEAEEMVREARDLVQFGPNAVIKIPMTLEGIKAVNRLSEMDIPTNVTLVFSVNQALLAAKAGANYVSPFVGRLDDIGTTGMDLVYQILEVYAQYDFATQVIVASIRHPEHVLQSAQMGAHVATVPFAVLDKLASHPLTDKGLEKFLQDWKKIA
ncbi:MAG: fructose-6-phosphate aldolase [Desulfohalobiaceae bacterium]|nr:fructose-6-phosphate aldolase [Desulfohalobiaceae bacterium]